MKIIKRIFQFLGIVVIILSVFLLVMTALEYRPDEIENVEVYRPNTKEYKLQFDETYKMFSYNIGYGGLDESTDFFMDGGKMTRVESKDKILENISNILDYINHYNPNFLLIQEIDENSHRSYNVNQIKMFDEDLMSNRAFAYNFKTKYVPIPIMHPLGEVNSGLYTASNFTIDKARRISHPNFFKYPVRLFNLKRALLETRYNIEGTDKQLVVYNLHIDAYVNKEAKAKQTEHLIKVIEEEYKKGNYVIAAGDFNQILEEYKNDKNTSDTAKFEGKSEYFDLYFESGVPTCRYGNVPYKKDDPRVIEKIIDGYLVSKNIEVTYVKTYEMDFMFSDHNPVLLDFKLIR